MSCVRHPEYQYLDLAKKILNEGIKNTDRANGDTSYSLFGGQCRYDLKQGLPLLTTKKMYWKGVLFELIWFLKGMSNIDFLVQNDVHIWDDYPYYAYQKKVKAGKYSPLSKEEFIENIRTNKEFAQMHGELKRIYGELWRRWPTKNPHQSIDQVDFVLRELTQDPDARNAIITAWNPEFLYTMAHPEDASLFPICHALLQFSIKNNALSCHLYQRSADLFLGVPFNIASYAVLTHIIAHLLGREVGEFIHSFGDVHIYENHVDQMRIQIEREPRGFPTLTINPDLKSIDEVEANDFILSNYNPHPALTGKLAVVGGMLGREDDES